MKACIFSYYHARKKPRSLPSCTLHRAPRVPILFNVCIPRCAVCVREGLCDVSAKTPPPVPATLPTPHMTAIREEEEWGRTQRGTAAQGKKWNSSKSPKCDGSWVDLRLPARISFSQVGHPSHPLTPVASHSGEGAVPMCCLHGVAALVTADTGCTLCFSFSRILAVAAGNLRSSRQCRICRIHFYISKLCAISCYYHALPPSECTGWPIFASFEYIFVSYTCFLFLQMCLSLF